jgi:hypothetical protein
VDIQSHERRKCSHDSSPSSTGEGHHANPVEDGHTIWLFAGSERAGQRAAAIMSLLATAKANGHDPHAWLTDVLTRLPTTLDRDIGTLLPTSWKPAA